jgi:hypothetical protein
MLSQICILVSCLPHICIVHKGIQNQTNCPNYFETYLFYILCSLNDLTCLWYWHFCLLKASILNLVWSHILYGESIPIKWINHLNFFLKMHLILYCDFDTPTRVLSALIDLAFNSTSIFLLCYLKINFEKYVKGCLSFYLSIELYRTVPSGYTVSVLFYTLQICKTDKRWKMLSCTIGCILSIIIFI